MNNAATGIGLHIIIICDILEQWLSSTHYRIVQRDIRYGVWVDTLPYRLPAPESLFSQYMATMPYLLHGGEYRKAHIANYPQQNPYHHFKLKDNVQASIMFVIQ